MPRTPFILLLLGSLVAWDTTGRAADAPAPVVIRPESAPGPLDNPLKGWCPYVDAGPITLPYSMVYHYASWKELEPTEGNFDFGGWERRVWNNPAARGKHVVFRVYVDYPGRPSGLPDWLKDQVKLTSYIEYGGGLSPDYENPALIAGMERLIAALGRRYDHDPRVAFLELGLLGYWGEWHTYPNEKLQPSVATETRIINAYRQAFPTVGLMARYARDDAGTRDWLGYHDDMFPEDTDNGHDWSFLAGIRRAGRLDNWKRAPIGGEMVPGAARKWVGDPQTRTMIDRSHFSWVGPYCPALARKPNADEAARLVRQMGYQFRWTELQYPARIEKDQPVEVKLTGVNDGVAPFYKDWAVELALIADGGQVVSRNRLKTDVRSWLPGPFAVETSAGFTVPPGRYALAIGIIDPMTGEPAIKFANSLEDKGGWTVLGPLEVVAARRDRSLRSDTRPGGVLRGEARLAEPGEEGVEGAVLLDQTQVPRGGERGEFGPRDGLGHELSGGGETSLVLIADDHQGRDVDPRQGRGLVEGHHPEHPPRDDVGPGVGKPGGAKVELRSRLGPGERRLGG